MIKAKVIFPSLDPRWQQQFLHVLLTSLTGCLHTTWTQPWQGRALFLPDNTSPFHDLTITTTISEVSLICNARNLGVTLDDSCPSLPTLLWQPAPAAGLFSITFSSTSFCSFLTQMAQVLIQALVIFCLDYCDSLLAGVPAPWTGHWYLAATLFRLFLHPGHGQTIYPHPVHYALLEAIGLLLPRCWWTSCHLTKSQMFAVLAPQRWNATSEK